MKQSMVSPLTGQLPNKPFTLGGFASENKVCCLQNHHFLGWKTKKYGDFFCVWWLVIPTSSVVQKKAGKFVAASRQKERRPTLKNVPPPKKKAPRHGAIMKAPIKTWQSGQLEGRAQNQVSYGGLGDISQPYQGDRSNKLGQFFNDWAPKNRAFFMGTPWFSL